MNNTRILFVLLLSGFACALGEFVEDDASEYFKTIDEFENEAIDKYENEEIDEYENEADDYQRLGIPQQVDWTKQKVVSRVVNQGRYSTSWAFAAIGLIESRLAIKSKTKVVELSKQNLIDCMKAKHERVQNSIGYIKQQGWIATERSYSYRGINGNCKYRNVTKAYVKIDKYYAWKLPLGREIVMAQEVARGPVIAFVNKVAITKYTGGILSKVKCGESSDYAVLVVGYGRTAGQDYWLLKTSRGTGFGERGYMRLARNKGGLCGISKKVSYVTLK